MGCHQHCASQDARGVARRRSFIVGLACTAIVPGSAFAQLAGPGSDADVRFMRMAIEDATGRLPVRCRDRAGRRGHCARAQPRTRQRRPDRARRNGRDPAVPGGSWSSRVERQHALHVRRILCDVHGSDHLVSHGATRLWRLDRPTRHQDRPDHADRRRYCREGSVRPDFNHRRCARRRGDGAVYEVVHPRSS